ncbi:tetratricopeptide repeat protein [Calothrix sp. UHCC 0171]|uniref:tetratricopeptide repeat protein n=1 Tax=Calothrix sp. UHCC 0171 TaxID=3110245 RepID=UPI002B20D99B|nr:tetratricopeptide repeat protein [Calothrix sp. UHCC 0171]MEA5570538.1 tetratricopeptide repeat protein [Calothrix sp. UHCC 0171]
MEIFQSPTNLIAATIVFFAAAILIYFAWKTLITSNLYQKGVTLYQKKDYEAAEATFRQVIAINSTNDVVHLLLGDCLMQQDRVKEAMKEFQDVIQRAPKKVDAYLRLSNAFIAQGNRTEAITNLEKSRDLFQTQKQPQQAEQVNQLLQKLKTNQN